ncbi:MAG: hypothetical protein EBZ15_04680 [Actinobacteria bacterium]|nr:hypothetical protein [Actinomycetota bacterium]NDA50538.1 hypothetical protein [Actinomycetota bacterium]
MTDHDNPDDASDSSADEPSSLEPSSLVPPAVEPSASSPSVMALAGAITGALGVVLAALPILAMLWVWLAL